MTCGQEGKVKQLRFGLEPEIVGIAGIIFIFLPWCCDISVQFIHVSVRKE